MIKLFCGPNSPQQKLFEDAKNFLKDNNVPENDDDWVTITNQMASYIEKYKGTEVERLARKIFMDILEDVELRREQ